MNLNSIVDEKTKDCLVNVLSEAIFNALEDNIEDLIKSIDIKKGDRFKLCVRQQIHHK